MTLAQPQPQAHSSGFHSLARQPRRHVLVVCDDDHVAGLCAALRFAREKGYTIVAPGFVARAIARQTSLEVEEIATDFFAGACDRMFANDEVAFAIAPQGSVTLPRLQERVNLLAQACHVPCLQTLRDADLVQVASRL